MTDPASLGSAARTAALLSEVASRLDRELAAVLEDECALPLVWFEVLRRIDETEEGYVALGRLAELIVLSTGGVTRLVDRMEQAGVITRTACPTDRRSTFVKLTPAGLDLLARARVAYERRAAEVLAATVSEHRLQDLRRALAALGDGLQRT